MYMRCIIRERCKNLGYTIKNNIEQKSNFPVEKLGYTIKNNIRVKIRLPSRKTHEFNNSQKKVIQILNNCENLCNLTTDQSNQITINMTIKSFYLPIKWSKVYKYDITWFNAGERFRRKNASTHTQWEGNWQSFWNYRPTVSNLSLLLPFLL